ncbi:MAG: putative glycoside hydrolase, partial [Anaerolineales bacterium]|nr:putative glycoside hydrolase [Anaerolineales bacterium]
MKRSFFRFIFIFIIAALLLPLGGVTRVEAASGVVAVAPIQLANLMGVYRGSVASLRVKDQTGTQNVPSKYVLFQTPGAYYRGYSAFAVPKTVSPATVTTIRVTLNYNGLPRARQRWLWYLYDWNTKAWVYVGDNALAKSNVWSGINLLVRNAGRFVRSDGRVQLLMRSNNSAGDAKLDYLKLIVSYSTPQTGPAFPRLGMWWPDLWTQPASDVARYDFVVLNQGEEGFISSIKTLNPNIKLLTATNACELSFFPGQPLLNDKVKNIPAEWFLTQVGTTLSAGVNASQTDIHVNATTVSDGTNTYALFVAGDAVLIEGESMLVNSVNAATNTLTVHRGYIRPASSHAAGTRIAAHITFWPNSWVMNLSALSAKVIYDPNVGAENWAEYDARVSAQMLADEPRWDGILADRSDGSQSWLIGNSTARTIDPDQSNTLLTNYSNFDAAWNAGLRVFESNLRARAGTNKIIYTNWGYPNYDLLNGTNLEGFPDDLGGAHGVPWYQSVFSPHTGVGGYFEWVNNALQPNLTMVETYEDNSGPAPNQTGEYINPYTQPGFVPNYRKMRFGLGTALLSDGYFSYEINTNGHGSLGLLWFDEYDNAGAGRGYLGYPLGNAARVWTTLPTPNLVSGGGLNTASDFSQWSIWSDTGYAMTAALDSVNPAEGSAS